MRKKFPIAIPGNKPSHFENQIRMMQYRELRDAGFTHIEVWSEPGHTLTPVPIAKAIQNLSYQLYPTLFLKDDEVKFVKKEPKHFYEMRLGSVGVVVGEGNFFDGKHIRVRFKTCEDWLKGDQIEKIHYPRLYK